MPNLQEYSKKLSCFQAQRRLAIDQCKQERLALDEAKANVQYTEEATKIIQEVAETIQNKVHQRISQVVTRCLETVFGTSAYAFRIDFRKSRGKTEAILILERDGLVLEEPLAEAGGGIIDIASFALRLACLLLSQPRRRRLLCLDEPFKMVSQNYVPMIRQLLIELAKDMEIQIIMVTHNRELQIGKVVELS